MAVALLAAAGCGGSGSGDGKATTPPPAAIGGPGGQVTSPAGNPTASASTDPAKDPLHPTVLIETSLGNITVQLDAEKAPLTVDNFLSYAGAGHYAQTIFHQVLKDYPKVIIGGAYTAEKIEKQTRTPIFCEAHNGLKNRRGAVAMARRPDAPDSATCHFFIDLGDNEALDHKDRTLEGYGYCVFGQVVEGIEVADKIAAVEVTDAGDFERIPVEAVLIKSIRQIR
jgi:peptidyl-prolyl cis-trans isomerase B (cyclophilin B)